MSSRLCFCCLNVVGFHFAYAPEFLKVDSPLKLGIDLRPILFVYMINSNIDILTNLLISILNWSMQILMFPYQFHGDFVDLSKIVTCLDWTKSLCLASRKRDPHYLLPHRSNTI